MDQFACLRPEDLSTRISLLAEYLSLQPSAALLKAAAAEEASVRTARLFADRINEARFLDLTESPSETRLLDHALAKCAVNAHKPTHSAKIAQHMTGRQRTILSQLYPSHPMLFDTIDALEDVHRRIALLSAAMDDQSLALTKLADAANLLTLIADHVEILCTTYANSCLSSSSDDCSSEEDPMSRTSCLGRGRDDPRVPMYITSVPANYRIRYLRKCWSFAAEALSTAVHLSTYLERSLEREGKPTLVPGIEAQSKPSLTLFELPGGLTVILRSETLHRMSNEAKRMRELVHSWQARQRRFLARLQRDLAKAQSNVSGYEGKLAELRQSLLVNEFAENGRSKVPMKHHT